jgi:hypothetical protein
MSTATMEISGPATQIVPEKLYPARGKLVRSMSEFELGQSGLEDFRGRLARNESDEAKALDADDDDALARAQSQTNILKARINQREAVLVRLLNEFESSVTNASTELNGLVAVECDRRRGILGRRVCEVLESSEQLHTRGFLEDCFAFSKPLQAVETLRVYFTPQSGNVDGSLGAAKRVLDCYEKVIAAAQEEIRRRASAGVVFT